MSAKDVPTHLEHTPAPPFHPRIHLADIQPRPKFLQAWERLRHRQLHWLVECMSELVGVFMYCYAGMGAQAAYNLGNLGNLNGLGSVFEVGCAYAVGLGLGLVVCSANGPHFSPAITLVRVLFQGFPAWKGVRFVIAQLLGGYIAALLVYAQWRNLILEVEAALIAAGRYDAVNFTPQGIAGIFGLYVLPGSSLRWVFLNEFVTDFMLGLVIYACLDPTNFFAPPAAGPWLISFAFAIAIWGFSPAGLSANAARDVGGRLAALTIWGTDAAGGNYAAIAALTTFPATIAAFIFYEMFFVDSARVVPAAQREYIQAHALHMEHGSGTGDNALPSPDPEKVS
ncbi:aquaporin-like protein [Vararia minispora EC-137]|uniref:Aquaporin-like protein n=1 Tax=Vararia minispora EC-137 TaxID=1314806 RepID=A0ACB8Q5M6_9AGAM|nr:aquaporin-like protein [Vararia minispora EC-137]